jgi:hypothetical protein
MQEIPDDVARPISALNFLVSDIIGMRRQLCSGVVTDCAVHGRPSGSITTPTCNAKYNAPLSERHTGTLSDGSRPNEDYSPGLNCAWPITSPGDAPFLQLRFHRFATEPLYDVLTVSDAEGNPVGRFSGNIDPFQVSSSPRQ